MSKPTNKDLTVVPMGKGKVSSLDDNYEDIVSFIHTKVRQWADARSDLEATWTACWAHYFSTPQSANWLRATAFQLGTPSDETDWRHRIHHGKAFDLVETVNSYLQQAFFPGEDWFSLIPATPPTADKSDNWSDRLDRVQAFILYKLSQANFEDWWDIFCRQACVVGTSPIALPYRYDVKPSFKNVYVREADGMGGTRKVPYEKVVSDGLDIEVIDMFDFWLDPTQNFSGVIDGDCIRRLYKTRAEVIRLVKEGVYTMIEPDDVLELKMVDLANDNLWRNEISDMVGLDNNDPSLYSGIIQLYEFWGDVVLEDTMYQDVCVTICDNVILGIENNPFWDGKPFVIGTYVNTQGSPYGVSLLQPVLGQLHQMFEIQNHRLDVNELAINPMYLVVDDGILDMENLYSEPARVIPVADVNSIKPIQLGGDSSVSVQDEGLLSQSIEKTTGVGAYLGVNSGRDGERVTAEEVRAQRNAGGNRLNRIHGHIETTALYKFLQKAYCHLQQFVTSDTVIPMPSKRKGISYEFWQVGQEELQDSYEIRPIGSAHIADQERDIKNLVDYISIVSSNPELSQRTNWDNLSNQIARKFMRENWSKYVQQVETPPAPTPEASPPPPPPTPSPADQMLAQASATNPIVSQGMSMGGTPGAMAAMQLSQPQQQPY